MPSDPFFPVYGHPLLPAGFNEDPIAGDEVDGAGTNEPIWPEYFVATVCFAPLLLDEEDMDRFGETCADYIVACTDDTLRLPSEFEVLQIRRRA